MAQKQAKEVSIVHTILTVLVLYLTGPEGYQLYLGLGISFITVIPKHHKPQQLYLNVLLSFRLKPSVL